jgi:Ca2+-binding EF-hand superfamily protein
LTFEEFSLFLTITDPSTKPEDIVEIVFALYDDDGNGHISKAEVMTSLVEIYNMKGFDVKDSEMKEKINKHAEEILLKCDESKDGYISKDEMLKVLISDRELLLGQLQ